MRMIRKILKWMLIFDILVAVAAVVAKKAIPEIGDEESDQFQLVTMLGGRRFKSRAGALVAGTTITGMGGIQLDLSGAAFSPAGINLEVISIMGGTEIDLSGADLSESGANLNVVSIMGGTEIDLSGAAIPVSGARLSLVSVMGGVEVTVPVEWHVDLHGCCVGGGHVGGSEEGPEEGQPVLDIHATGVLSGTNIKKAKATL